MVQVPLHLAAEPDDPVHLDSPGWGQLAGVLDGHVDHGPRTGPAAPCRQRVEGIEGRLAVQGGRPAREDRRPVRLGGRQRAGVVDVHAGVNPCPRPPPHQLLEPRVVHGYQAARIQERHEPRRGPRGQQLRSPCGGWNRAWPS